MAISKCAVRERKRELKQLHSCGHGHRLIDCGRHVGRVGQSFFDSIYIEAAGGVAAFEAIQDFARFSDFAGQIIERRPGWSSFRTILEEGRRRA